ncbi:ATP-grasp domain-containing protein [Streptomyces sp. NBC_01142]|uniref:carboxylate--amine ligase n=1 Tax=Streptomyces sp. NBC_01142 TaxID=2975865 RepID=UPI00225714A8|nr:ATP-grasp domain-containing protein [Streptomyces sp. NBC_01142]MCX4819049.1 ATP-grasp domain-containing protein [Streptomyces sp. NBC_01142]
MSSFDSVVPALVLRLDRNPFHHGTLGAVRSLGRAGVEVHAVVEAANSPVGRSRYLHRAHPGPRGAITAESFAEMLIRISERIGRRAVLIAMDDLSAIHTAAQAPLLAPRFVFPDQGSDLPRRLADKAELAGLCAQAGIAHPETVIPSSAAEAGAAVRHLGLPLVAKWSRPWLLGATTGLRSTTLVRSPQDACRLFGESELACSRLLLQRYLPDGPDTDWFFHGYFSGDSRCLLGGSGRKELSWPTRTGLTALGRWQPNAQVEEAARRLVSHVGYRGILDLDFRREEAGGTYQLVDVNPRTGAQFRLFTDPGGLDVVRTLYLDLTGQRVPRPVSRPGRVFVAENYALLSALFSVGRTRPPATGHKGGVETAWFAGDDMLPFLAMARAWLGRGLSKGVHRMRTLLRTAALRPAK